MKISVKNLKGEVFQVEAESTDQISVLKAKIQTARNELAADRQKLIHSGKILRDDQTIAELGLSESDFLVCMLSKEVAKKPAPQPAKLAEAAPSSAPAPSAAPVASQPADQPAAQPAAAPAVNISAESVQQLVNMGFPEAESRAALTAAMGDPNLAFEFLSGGVQMPPAPAARPAAQPAAPAPAGAVSIEQLRQHPQFNMLKQLVQQNPAAIPQVLDLISQQSPALYAAIQADNDAFISMMNEPITDTPAPQATPVPAATTGFPAGGAPGGLPGAGDAANMIGFLSALPPQQRAQFAQTLGMSPQELEGFIMMMNSLPPEQLQQVLGGALGGASGAGGRNTRVVRLTEDEMAAVNRLMELGFSQQQAAEAYLACDKNEELAANLLLGGGFAEDEMMGDFGGGDDGGGDDDHDDEMYS